MKDGKGTFNVLASIQKHIEALTPLLPKQALVCIGEYPIKSLLKDAGTSKEGTLSILIEKSSDEIYKWLPKGYRAHLVLGYEDARIDTHFWYNALPTISKDNSVIESLRKKNVEKLHSAIIYASVWDGIGSAALPCFIGKFKSANMDSLSIGVLPSKIQPADAHFNAYAALTQCLAVDGAAVLLMGRDQIEGYEGVNRRGELLKGNLVANYLLNLFLAKDTLVEEIAELSRTFNVKLYTPIVVTGASYRVYGSIENMLDAALLKPFLAFDVSTASLLYVVLRMPSRLKDKLSRGRIELAITNWFKEKTSLKSIYITEPIYTEDMTDRIDAVLFIGGFDISKMLSELEAKVKSLKNQAIERGLITEDLQFITKKEEIATPIEMPPKEPQTPKVENNISIAENIDGKLDVSENVTAPPQATVDAENLNKPKTAAKPKARAKKPEPKKRAKKVDRQKGQKTPAT